VPVNFRLAAREMADGLSDAMPLILFVDYQYIKTVEQIKSAAPSVKDFVYMGPKEEKPEGWYDYEELIENASFTEDGIDCVGIPPHLVTEPKVNRVKTDKRDANRLALVLENHDFKDACHVPDKERREDRQISRTLIGCQVFFHLDKIA
jgi:hypothetical protein